MRSRFESRCFCKYTMSTSFLGGSSEYRIINSLMSIYQILMDYHLMPFVIGNQRNRARAKRPRGKLSQ